MLSACADTVTWQEEVLLNDGRTIVVTQKRRCEAGRPRDPVQATCLARESWLTLKLPEFSGGDIVWHESLKPMLLNVHEGRLYVVGRAPTTRELRAYGATNPPYFGFRWNGGRWERIPFSEIPVAIYAANLVIESVPTRATKFLTLQQKNSVEENGNPVFSAYLRRIDPRHTTPSQ